MEIVEGIIYDAEYRGQEKIRLTIDMSIKEYKNLEKRFKKVEKLLNKKKKKG